MTNTYPPLHASRPTSGTEDDDDDRDDEHEGENEALIREVDETTETPEEFEIEDEVGDPEHDSADVQPEEESELEEAERLGKARAKG